MLKGVAGDGPVVFTGGAAKNLCIRLLAEDILGKPILTADDPQLVGAIGAALIMQERATD